MIKIDELLGIVKEAFEEVQKENDATEILRSEVKKLMERDEQLTKENERLQQMLLQAQNERVTIDQFMNELNKLTNKYGYSIAQVNYDLRTE